MYEITPEKVGEIFEGLENYGIVEVDVENVASILDDMLDSTEKKLEYAREKLKDGNVDKAVLVVRDGTGTLIVKIENVIEIRAVLRDYEKLIGELKVER